MGIAQTCIFSVVHVRTYEIPVDKNYSSTLVQTLIYIYHIYHPTYSKHNPQCNTKLIVLPKPKFNSNPKLNSHPQPPNPQTHPLVCKLQTYTTFISKYNETVR